VTIPYNAIARSQGWSPRGWFGLTEPQQVAVLRASTRSLGLFGTTLAADYESPFLSHAPFASDPRVQSVLRTEGPLRAEVLRAQLQADALAATTPASKPPAPVPVPAPTTTRTTTTRTTTATRTPAPPPAPALPIADAPAPTSSALPLLVAAAAAWAVLS